MSSETDTSPQVDAPADDGSDLVLMWGVGAVSVRVGIATPTLRTWERRYGIGPSQRTEGGHRRYNDEDVSRVQLMGRLVTRGVPPQAAARVALSLDPDGLASALVVPEQSDADDRLVADVAPTVAIEAILAAAEDLDALGLSRVYSRTMSEMGVVDAWTRVIAPALGTVGDRWFDGTLGVDSEHLASERLASELRTVIRSRRPNDMGATPVVLASAEDDQHALPLLAAEAALAADGAACYSLGGRLPVQALTDMVHRVRPGVVFLWSSLARPRVDHAWRAFADVTWPLTVLVGGPGWSQDVVERSHDDFRVELVDDLGSAVERITAVTRAV
ncbi:MerR family transcriptional regulator [Solicola sp. PLA-1-18]|uniref:MerR family transcriptional regulator n=1 Tax=Solicola sp. PLA-1-18 TaxID=3380532 RepID=UPI003B76DD00